MIYFVPSTRGMILGSWKEDGTYNENTWPHDAVEMTAEEEAAYWLQSPPSGKEIGVIEGRPAWVEIPPPSEEDLITSAAAIRDELLRVAAIRIAPLQDAVDLEDATQAETALLKGWKRYRVALNRLTEQPEYPASIDWPTPPA